MTTKAVQDYLKEIYHLQNGCEPVDIVSTSLLAERLQVTAASVTNMLKHLAKLNLIQYVPYRGVKLSGKGETIAIKVLRRHRLIELFLHQTLGFPWDEVHEEAHRLEHVISDRFEERIDAVLGYPAFDPHGSPIPDKNGSVVQENHRQLSEVDDGNTVVIREVKDGDPNLLRYLESLGLGPNVKVKVVEKAPFHGPITIRINRKKEVPLGLEVARQIYVSEI